MLSNIIYVDQFFPKNQCGVSAVALGIYENKEKYSSYLNNSEIFRNRTELTVSINMSNRLTV